MVTVQLEQELELTRRAQEAGRSEESLVRELILEYLEDRADYDAAVAAIKKSRASGKPPISSAEMKRRLGLEPADVAV